MLGTGTLVVSKMLDNRASDYLEPGEGDSERGAAKVDFKNKSVRSKDDIMAALPDLLAASAFPLGVSPSDFGAWYADWWPEGGDAKPGTTLVGEWFADAEAEVHDGRTPSDKTVVVLAWVAEMQQGQQNKS